MPNSSWKSTLFRPTSGSRGRRWNVPADTYELVKGWFDDTIPPFAETSPRIAVLRLDGDWYESTMCCLTNLFPHVVENGLVLIDDYGYWEGCTRAVHDYLSAEKRTEPIQHSKFSVTFLVKGTGYAALP